VDEGEDCDPPGEMGCNADCLTIRCGDGRLDSGELCEPMGPGDTTCSADCAPIAAGGPTYLFTFDSDIQNWKFYQAAPTKLASATVLSFDSQNGDVSPGVLKVVSPFDAHNQKIDFQVSLPTMLDLTGKTVRARARLAGGLSTDPAHPGGIKMFAKSGANYDYASGAWTTLTPGGTWLEVSFVADAPILKPGTFSPSEVRQIGFELRTFNESTDHAKVMPATLFVDSIGY
jgi:hypothetical protein